MNDDQLKATFSFSWSDQPEGEVKYREDVNLDVFSLWEIARNVQELGPERAKGFAEFMVLIAHLHPDVDNPAMSPTQRAKVLSVIQTLTGLFSRKWESSDLESQVIDFTYQLMRKKMMSRTLAAQFASIKLRKHYTPDAWRLKVDRWAKNVAKLPKVEFRKSLKP